MPVVASEIAWARRMSGSPCTKPALAGMLYAVPSPHTNHRATVTTRPGWNKQTASGAAASSANGLMSWSRRSCSANRVSRAAPTVQPQGMAARSRPTTTGPPCRSAAYGTARPSGTIQNALIQASETSARIRGEPKTSPDAARSAVRPVSRTPPPGAFRGRTAATTSAPETR